MPHEIVFRVVVPGGSPRGLACDGEVVWVACESSPSISKIPLRDQRWKPGFALDCRRPRSQARPRGRRRGDSVSRNRQQQGCRRHSRSCRCHSLHHDQSHRLHFEEHAKHDCALHPGGAGHRLDAASSDELLARFLSRAIVSVPERCRLDSRQSQSQARPRGGSDLSNRPASRRWKVTRSRGRNTLPVRNALRSWAKSEGEGFISCP